MLCKFIEYKQQILTFAAENEDSVLVELRHEHFAFLERLCQVLKVFYDATVTISERTATATSYLQILGRLEGMLDTLSEQPEFESICSEMLTELKTQQKKSKPESNKILQLAQLFDPNNLRHIDLQQNECVDLLMDAYNVHFGTEDQLRFEPTPSKKPRFASKDSLSFASLMENSLSSNEDEQSYVQTVISVSLILYLFV